MSKRTELQKIVARMLVLLMILCAIPIHAEDVLSPDWQAWDSDVFTLEDVTLLGSGTTRLNELLQSVTLMDENGQAISQEDRWAVSLHTLYRIGFTFSEQRGDLDKQFRIDDTLMTYALPAGVDWGAEAIDGEIAVDVGERGAAHGRYAYDPAAGVITLAWNTEEEAFADLQLMDDVSIELTLDAVFTGEEQVIAFSDAILVQLETGEAFLSAQGEDYAVRLYPAPGESLPEGAEAVVQEITDAAYQTKAADQLKIDESGVQFIRVFDISIQAGGEVIEPEGPVRVEIDMAVAGEKVSALHFAADRPQETVSALMTKGMRTLLKTTPAQEQVSVLDVEVVGGTVQFDADSFSVFAIVGYTLEKRVLASDGNTYLIKVTYGADAGIPEGAALDVAEIAQDPSAGDAMTEYERYLESTEQALGLEAGSLHYARFFDIHIVDAEGNVIQPAEGATVRVSIRLDDMEAENELKAVHFGEQTEILHVEVDQNTVFFDAAGFSVYAIVDAPEPVSTEIRIVTSVEELIEGVGFYLSYGGTQGTNNYISSNLNGNSCFIEVSNFSSAAVWYFEADGGNYKIYTYVNGEKKYLANTSGNLVGLTDNGVSLSITPSPENGKFYFKSARENKWLQHSNGGGGIRFYTDNNNATNSRLAISYASSYTLDNDPYGLDGATFGIAFNNESVTAATLMAEEKTVGSAQRLAATDMLIRPDVLDHDGLLLVAQGSDITFWTFENLYEDKYYIKTVVDGQEKYLTIRDGNVTLEDTPDQNASQITATPGTGANSGKWHFTDPNGYSLNFSGSAANGFGAAKGNGATTWMNLLEESVLTDDDFHKYSAKKVSISDQANVYDGQTVVVYTRIWNDTTKRYEFYAVDHDGTLIRCYDNGDGIEWIGSQVNTALWQFTEYFENGSPNYFYELKNVQYGQYIAPQVTGGQILSGSPIGINLNGRRYGENYSTIVAWDDANYAYVGLKTEDGHVVACPLSEAEDFYFAVVNPIDPDDHLTTVATIDNNAYGITMKMIDFNNPLKGDRDSVQHAFFGAHDGNKHELGLLSTNLTDNYPTTTMLTGHEESLSALFNNMTTVNHLFLKSIHNESGYFEYSSTQNFAHLNADGNFTVYDQIGQVGVNYGNQGDFGPTRTHGQFMPYNDLVEGRYSTATNRTDVLGQELPDVDPRKDEKLYIIPKNEADYFFGMELSASFTQTASGLDAWGHDIIFEFSGDDDFWLYVDGELVIDLGGVRPALTGSVNFRTGVVMNAGTTTSLYEVFKKNYQTRGMSAAEINAKLDEIFTLNADGQYVFKDYTNHDMRIFYMERGAGASNLHMRFNLAAVKPGTFILNKTLSGVEEEGNSLIEFPYQIYYTTQADGEATEHLLTDHIGNNTVSVVYEGTSLAVPYKETFTPAGGTESYEHVFILKPGESAEVTLPDDAVSYRVVECGVNPDIYDRVSVNGDQVTGQNTRNFVNGTARQDYSTTKDTLDRRSEVSFDNHVQEDAMRTLQITKRLYDVDGERLLHYPDNDTLFNFRLYVGGENADPDSLPLANMYAYFVKDAQGNYCRWDADAQRFASLGKTNYDALTAEEKESATFTTSGYGSISKIPADHTVEVRNLILGTQYMVEERNYEIPRGYTLRSGDGYTRVDLPGTTTTGDQPYTGSILRDEDPHIEVRNQKGWGMTVEKVWTDKDFMESHDDIFFAVYIRTNEGYILYDGSVRRFAAGDTDLYIFFEDLTYQGKTYVFSDFAIFEVQLSGNYSVGEDGVVTGYSQVTPIQENGQLTVDGKPISRPRQSFAYTVHYKVGQTTGHNENVRTDVVTNFRPGIALYKTDLNDDNLAGAVFTLTDENGSAIAAPSFTSGSDGLITVAYLAPGTYFLTEIRAPKGYVVLDEPVKITLTADNQVSISPHNQLCQIATDGGSEHIAVITVKNRPTGLLVKKIDALTNQPLQNVHFALYHQVTDANGNPRRDYRPITGYSDIVTDANGVLAQINMDDLAPGTYYLSETRPAEGYAPLEDDLCFTIGENGTVTAQNHPLWLQREVVSGSVSYRITIPNGFAPDPVQIVIAGKKTLLGRHMEAGEFQFIMTPVDVDGVAISQPLTALCAEGEAGQETDFSFDALIYQIADYYNAPYRDANGNALFYYVVEENIPIGAQNNVSGAIEYATDRYLVVVTLSFQGGELGVHQAVYIYDGQGVPANLRPADTAQA